MILDSKLEFSDAQAICLSIATSTDSTNVLDLQVADPNIGAGTPIWLIVRVNTLFAPTLATLLVEPRDADGANSLSLATAIMFSKTFSGSLDELEAGDILISMPLPANIRRYMKILYTTAGSTLTAGKLDAFLSLTAPRALTSGS